MKKCYFFLLCTAMWLGAEAQIDNGLAQNLQQILEDRVNSGDNGVSACVIMPDGSIWKGVAGVDANNSPITDTTLFHGASTTKTSITTVIMLLAEEGLLDLDDSWTEYVSLDVAFDPAITIRQLISNTSGIADYLEVIGAGDLVTNDPNHFFTPQEILEDIVSDVPDFEPGTDFFYSSSNFVLAGLVIEGATGNTAVEELHNRVWDPLGLQHTYYGGVESYTEPRAGVWWNFGDGLQSYNAIPETSMLTIGTGSGNIVSNPEDLAHLVRALMTGEIVSENSLEQMMQFIPQSYDDWPAGYGLGIHHQYGNQLDEVLGHDGYFGNMTDMFHSMNHGFTLVTMTNTQTGWFQIFNAMYDEIVDYLETSVPQVVQGDFKVFPNPVSDVVSITTTSGKNILAYVTDATGKQVLDTTFETSGRLVLSVSSLEAGMYYVHLQNDAGSAVVKLLVE